MIRLSGKLINRNDLFKWFENEDVVKIEIKKHENSNLRNKDLCRVYIYISTEDKSEIGAILGSCAKHGELKIPYLQGISTQKMNGWLSVKMINKLTEIEKEHNLNLSIPKSFYKLIAKYNN